MVSDSDEEQLEALIDSVAEGRKPSKKMKAQKRNV